MLKQEKGRNKNRRKGGVKISKGTKTILTIIAIWVVILVSVVIIKNISKEDKTEVLDVAKENIVKDNTDEEEYVQMLEDGGKLNTSEKFNKERKLGELTITNIQLKEIGGITTLLADVRNDKDIQTEKKEVEVVILNKSGEEITKLEGIIDPIEPKGNVKLNVSVTADVSNAYDFRISER